MITPTEHDLGEALEDLVSSQPFQPDTSSIVRRGTALRRRAFAARATAGVAVGAAAAVVAVTATGAATHRGPSGTIATATAGGGTIAAVPGGNQTLTQLASYITANPAQQPGDATLVQRTQSYPGRAPMQGFDLYTDSGKYFYSETESGLPAAIKSNANLDSGVSAREVAAAEYAATGDLTVAAHRMAYAPFADGKPPTESATQRALDAQMVAQKLAAAGKSDPGLIQKVKDGTGTFDTDNYIWMDSEDALQAGSGNPQVRAGILRLLSTLPGITVTHTQAAGQAALAISASGQPDLPANYRETITIGAATGIPISFVGATNGAAPSVTVSCHVSRVTVANIEAGRF
ncbi:hypothetical protein K6U06_22645 [Acidiferrimicrobium sp. IK]|uniref:hypothetical protein n=1 Tax=Acidiferrimicrobium sp. IK TaxID=2871700 RepID=UPI0021CAEED9|nr:hypothetical protein [Acidiferrimicrobium sp. IK]MCU4187179.1 hypothetical protein [Acidiferrimicrobium sp. IK]